MQLSFFPIEDTLSQQDFIAHLKQSTILWLYETLVGPDKIETEPLYRQFTDLIWDTLFAQALHVRDHNTHKIVWYFHNKSQALWGQSPIELLAQHQEQNTLDEWREIIKNALWRILHGIYS